MDNISHSLFGLLAGELVHRSLPQEEDPERARQRRALLLTASWAANNFPDLDLFYVNIMPAPLGYLLHHRGHTHTLLYILPQALILLGFLWLWPTGRRLLRTDATSRKGVAFVLVIGFILHLLLDSLNSYGIHPFHPFNSRWYYGDLVFIIEPFFWVALAAPLAMTISWSRARWFLLGFVFVPPVLFTAAGFLPIWSGMLLALTATGLAWLQKRAGKRFTALIATLLVTLGFIALQSFFSGRASRAVRAAIAEHEPADKILDVALTALPSNPLCWNFVSIQLNESGLYRLRRGRVSAAPNWLPVDRCPILPLNTEKTGAPSSSAATLTLPSSATIRWLLEETGKTKELQRRHREDCFFDAWLRFARAPSVNETRVTDLRFSSRDNAKSREGSNETANEERNFTTMSFHDFVGRDCPQFIPKWEYPRADLLSAEPTSH